MKKTITRISGVALVALSIFIACKTQEETEALSYLPTNVLPSCVVTPTEFKSWFESGSPSENGAVKPANSVTFAHADNCDFYQWSEQMFLWITSPSSGIYGQSKTVFESPTFFTVSPEFGANERKLIPHRPGVLLSAVPSLEKSIGVDSEEGQATGDALMSKGGALVYYITMVNDVYAQFLAMNEANKTTKNPFPTTQAELDQIIAYAKSKNIVLPDANALAMELKTSWVDASTVGDLSNYITIDAMVPTYTKTPTKWTIIPNKTQKIKLALLGVHIVGSTAGHPEMVWSTFEHKNNAPNLSYTYLDTNNKQQKVGADVTGAWTLNSNPADTTATAINISHMKFKGDTISANFKNAPANNTISASNTTRTKAWGVANAGVPNAENASVAASNSQIISINNSVQSQLVGNDVRKNYLFIGSTWTDSGTAPDGTSYSATNTQNGTAIGTSQLANTTMETYIQNGATYNLNGTCFLCHHDYQSAKPTLDPNFLSHVYADIRRGDSISAIKVKVMQ
jgi:hypothetical protein